MQVDLDKEEYNNSELAKRIGNEYGLHKNSISESGLVKVYWCKYGKKREDLLAW